MSASEAEREPLQARNVALQQRPKSLPIRPRMVPRRISIESDNLNKKKPMPQATSFFIFSNTNR